jgi:hypothetical protein
MAGEIVTKASKHLWRQLAAPEVVLSLRGICFSDITKQVSSNKKRRGITLHLPPVCIAVTDKNSPDGRRDERERLQKLHDTPHATNFTKGDTNFAKGLAPCIPAVIDNR